MITIYQEMKSGHVYMPFTFLNVYQMVFNFSFVEQKWEWERRFSLKWTNGGIMIQVMTHMSSGRCARRSGRKGGKGNKRATFGGKTGGMGRSWERSRGENHAAGKQREIWHFTAGGGEELFIPRFGRIPGCLALISTASCFSLLLFFLPPDWLDPEAAFSLPDPDQNKIFLKISRHGIRSVKHGSLQRPRSRRRSVTK